MSHKTAKSLSMEALLRDLDLSGLAGLMGSDDVLDEGGLVGGKVGHGCLRLVGWCSHNLGWIGVLAYNNSVSGFELVFCTHLHKKTLIYLGL